MVRLLRRSANRILVNVLLDGALAAAAAPLARWIADPRGGLLHPLWFLAGGGITLLLGGLPFRLSQQYWRFAGLSDLVGVMGGSVVSAALFAAAADRDRIPSAHHHIPAGARADADGAAGNAATGLPALPRPPATRRRGWGAQQLIILVGAGDAADAFIRATARFRRLAGFASRACLRLSERQAGRRMHNLPILGTAAEAHSGAGTGWRRQDRLPSVARRHRAGVFWARLWPALISQAESAGIPVRRAPQAHGADGGRARSSCGRSPSRTSCFARRCRWTGTAWRSLCRRPARAGDRGGRQHRVRARAPACRLASGLPGVARPERIRAMANRPRDFRVGARRATLCGHRRHTCERGA